MAGNNPQNTNNTPKLAVKGAGDAPGGLRSPLVVNRPPAPKGGRSPASNVTPISDAVAKTKPQVDNKPKTQIDLSNLHELTQQADTMHTALSYHMVDLGRKRRHTGLIVLLVLAIFGFSGSMLAFPRFKTEVLRKVTTTYDEVMIALKLKRKPKPSDKQLGRPLRGTSAADDRWPLIKRGPEALSAIIATHGNCQVLSNSARLDDPKIPAAERVLLGECFLLFDYPSGAEESLAPLAQRIRKTQESTLNAEPADYNLADGLHLLVTAYIRMGKPQAAEALLKGFCPTWKASNTCVARLMLHTEKKKDPREPAALLDAPGRLSPKAAARLWLGGALLAELSMKPQASEQRFGFALAAAPKDALALRKQIYEAQALSLYRRSESLKLKTAVDLALQDLSKLDKKAKIKLSALRELGTQATAKSVQKLLSREEISYKVRGDVEMIDILAPTALRLHLEEDFLKLLAKAKTHFEHNYKSSSAPLRRLGLWEVRSLISQRSYEQAIAALANLERRQGKSAVIHHLRGLCYLHQNQTKMDLAAAQEFQAATRLSNNWESLYALGVTMMRAGKPDQTALIIKDLEKQVDTTTKRFWTDMLKASWYLHTEKYVNGIKLLKDWSGREPGFSVPRQLLVDGLAKMGKKGEAEAEETNLMQLQRSTGSALTRDVLTSPLGPLAYEPRAID